MSTSRSTLSPAAHAGIPVAFCRPPTQDVRRDATRAFQSRIRRAKRARSRSRTPGPRSTENRLFDPRLVCVTTQDLRRAPETSPRTRGVAAETSMALALLLRGSPCRPLTPMLMRLANCASCGRSRPSGTRSRSSAVSRTRSSGSSPRLHRGWRRTNSRRSSRGSPTNSSRRLLSFAPRPTGECLSTLRLRRSHERSGDHDCGPGESGRRCTARSRHRAQGTVATTPRSFATSTTDRAMRSSALRPRPTSRSR